MYKWYALIEDTIVVDARGRQYHIWCLQFISTVIWRWVAHLEKRLPTMEIFTTTDYVFLFDDEEEEDDYNIQEGDKKKLTVDEEESIQFLEEKMEEVPK